MNAYDLIVYTPVTQTVVLYFFFYRHDLRRIMHPYREKLDEGTWMNVLSKLGLAGELPQGARAEKGIFLPTRVLISLIIAFAAWVGVITTVPLILSGTVFERFFTIIVALAEFIPAIILIFMLSAAWLGPFPVRPFASKLPEERLGSLVRHLKDFEKVEVRKDEAKR